MPEQSDKVTVNLFNPQQFANQTSSLGISQERHSIRQLTEHRKQWKSSTQRNTTEQHCRRASQPHLLPCGLGFCFCLNRAFTFDPFRTIPEIIHCSLKEKAANCIAEILTGRFAQAIKRCFMFVSSFLLQTALCYSEKRSRQFPLNRYL